MRPLARELVVGAGAGLAVGVWLATHDKVDPPLCYGCRGPVAVAHVAWGWTIGAAVVVALATALCAGALRGRRLVVPRWRGARHLAVMLITVGSLAVGGVLVVGVLSTAPWNLADLRP